MSTEENQVTDVALLSPAVGTGNVGDHLIETAIRRLLRDDVVFHRFTIRQPLKKPEIEAINATGFALLCGTNLYQHDWHSALTPDIIARIQVPVIPFGVGSSARCLKDIEVSKTTRQMIRVLHSRCILGSVRDPHSAAVVARAGVKNAVLTGCPVLTWARGKDLPTIQSVRRDRIVVTARNWLMHRWPENVDHPVQIHFLKTVFESFPSDQLVLAIHEDWDERLIDLLKIPRNNVFKSKYAADDTRLYTDQKNVILAMRLHAGMLGIANGVPAVFVGHDTRTHSFCQMMGLDCVDLFSEACAEECITHLQRIMNGDVTVFAEMQPRYRQLHGAMERFLVDNGLPVRRLNDAKDPECRI